MLEELKKDLEASGSKEKAKVLQRFFKTGPGEYGEGDVFLGVAVPEQRKVAKNYKDLSYPKIKELLESKIHEHRLVGLLILLENYRIGDERVKRGIFEVYLENLMHVNNWDLVDLSAPGIVGDFLLGNPEKKDVLYKLVSSPDLWQRRVAVLATFAFIRKNQFDDVLKIAELLLKDKEDLIHKAVGWMLREVGKRDQAKLEKFLGKFSGSMPRTMLRYAIERLPEGKRKSYLNK